MLRGQLDHNQTMMKWANGATDAINEIGRQVTALHEFRKAASADIHSLGAFTGDVSRSLSTVQAFIDETRATLDKPAEAPVFNITVPERAVAVHIVNDGADRTIEHRRDADGRIISSSTRAIREEGDSRG